MWYPKAVVRGTNKHGYGNDDTCQGIGLIAHSMEGSLAAAFAELDRPDRQASWHFSAAKDGTIYQHISTANISYASGSYEANRRFISIEHEGVAGEALTDKQKAATTELMRWILAEKGLQPIRKETLWEHREMVAFGSAATSCPSNRIPWNEIIPALQEDDVTPEELKQAIRDVLREKEFDAGGVAARCGGEGAGNPALRDLQAEIQAIKKKVGA